MPNKNEIRYGRDINRKSLDQAFIWSACVDCGKERWVRLIRGKPRHQRCSPCSGRSIEKKKFGAENPLWRGGRHSNGAGYIIVRVYPSDFFYPMASNGFVLEHRLVMAKYLNRCLLSWETVHHKNGVTDDNRIENLELFPSGYKHQSLSVIKKYINKLEKAVDRLTKELEARKLPSQ